MPRLLIALIAIFVAVPAQAAWNRAESSHFIIYSDGPEKDLHRYAERLEAAHWLMKAATGVQDSGRITKVRVYFVPEIDDVRRLIGRPNSDVAGYYQPLIDGPVAVVPRHTADGDFTGQLVLFHEYAHHFMLQYSPVAYPPWYVEGFAELMSTSSFRQKGAITYGRAAMHREAELKDGRLIPIKTLLAGTYRDGAENDYYGQSWLLTHYLTFSDKRAGQLRAFLTRMNQGQSQAEAAKAFGDLTQLERELHIYLETGSFIYKAPALPEGLGAETVVKPVSTGEAALIDERIELERRTERANDAAGKAARSVWLGALQAKVEAMGKDADALQLLADAQCASELWTACRATATRVLAAAPGKWDAMLRIGEAMLHEDKTPVAAARDWIVKANHAAPNAPGPLIAYYESFGREGRAAPAAALDGLIQAEQTVPQVGSVRLMLARALIGANRRDDARFILAPLAFAPHHGEGQAAAKAMIEELDGKSTGSADTTKKSS